MIHIALVELCIWFEVLLYLLCISGDHHGAECPEQAFSAVVSEKDVEVPLTVRQAGRHLFTQISQALCRRYEGIVGAVQQLLQCV